MSLDYITVYLRLPLATLKVSKGLTYAPL